MQEPLQGFLEGWGQRGWLAFDKLYDIVNGREELHVLLYCGDEIRFACRDAVIQVSDLDLQSADCALARPPGRVVDIGCASALRAFELLHIGSFNVFGIIMHLNC